MSWYLDTCPRCKREFRNHHEQALRFCSVLCAAMTGAESMREAALRAAEERDKDKEPDRG